MIVAITSTGQDLSATVDPRFGRTTYIILYNLDDDSFKCVSNEKNLSAPQGAGIQTAQNVLDKGAQAVITGNLGPKAFQVLNAANLKAYSCESISITDAVQALKDNKLPELTNPNVEGHWT